MTPHDPSALSRRRFLAVAATAAAAAPIALACDRTPRAAAVPRLRAAGVPAVNPIWSSDFDNAGFGNWESTPWNDEPQGAVARPTIVTSPSDPSHKAARFHLDGGQKRNESQPTGAQSIGEGDTLVVRFTDYLAAGFPVDTDDWQVVLQFKNDGDGSPPCEIKIGNGKYYLDGNNGSWHHDIGDAVTGEPIDIAVQVHFSASASSASMSAWYNGSQTLNGVKPSGAGTLYSGTSSYLKTGIYRDTAIGQAGTRYLQSLVIGTPA